MKICDKVTSTVPVHGGKGVADNNTMVRMDVYFCAGRGYYWVPIYGADTVKLELPNKAVVTGKKLCRVEGNGRRKLLVLTLPA